MPPTLTIEGDARLGGQVTVRVDLNLAANPQDCELRVVAHQPHPHEPGTDAIVYAEAAADNGRDHAHVFTLGHESQWAVNGGAAVCTAELYHRPSETLLATADFQAAG